MCPAGEVGVLEDGEVLWGEMESNREKQRSQGRWMKCGCSDGRKQSLISESVVKYIKQIALKKLFLVLTKSPS